MAFIFTIKDICNRSERLNASMDIYDDISFKLAA